MKTQLFKKIEVTLITIALFITSTKAQIVYTDVIPDTSGACTIPGCSQIYFFDLNADGNNDFSIEAMAFSNSTYCMMMYITFTEENIRVSSLDSNQIATVQFNLSDTISQQSPWTSNSTIAFHLPDPPCLTNGAQGYWNGTGFLGLKLKIGVLNYYGWVKLYAEEYGTSFTVFEYAFNSIPNQFILAGDTGNGPVGMIEAAIRNEINIFPNPFSTSATLSLNSNSEIENTQLKIFDVTGREVKQFEIRKHKTEINRKDLLSGIYFYKVQDENKIIYTGKLVVQ